MPREKVEKDEPATKSAKITKLKKRNIHHNFSDGNHDTLHYNSHSNVTSLKRSSLSVQNRNASKNQSN